ncbi:MAG: hypothetical protein JO217_01335, partial [Acidobacteriaceae bacterium]|nr:hypothetical protein [Acidobacteriaceae bacterium]
MNLRLLAGMLVFTLGTSLGQFGRDPREETTPSEKPKILYVWAADQAHRAPDFLAVIDFDEESLKYGHVINTVPLP